jgi:hypothetical protein
MSKSPKPSIERPSESREEAIQLRTGGRILVESLRIHGVERVFCVPGESYLDVLDALHDARELSVVVCKHEGAAAARPAQTYPDARADRPGRRVRRKQFPVRFFRSRR